MKKIVLVDGNNLLFRSYYATAYSGNIMRNNKGFPTNGLFGFVNMINKILREDSPNYLVVAFDIGKTFRHEEYAEYKGGRSETPDDLKMQFPVAKELLSKMGIKYLECSGYEADDIIGTLASMVDDDDSFEGLIVSSDKDLLQLISDKVSVKLLKSKDYILMDHDTFFDTYGIEPNKMIDLKGLMGDSSDNIPGVKGVGEKTALKLLKEYNNIDNLYNNIDNIKGAVKAKLENGRESAFMSRDIATIYKNVPIDVSLDDLDYDGSISHELIDMYKELGFNSFINKLDIKRNDVDIKFDIIDNIDSFSITDDVSLYLELSDDNYHRASIVGVGLYNDNISAYIPGKYISDLSFIKGGIYTYDAKRLYVNFRYLNYVVDNICDDVMIMGYLLNHNSVSGDICNYANGLGYDIPVSSKKEDISDEDIAMRCVAKAKFIYDIRKSNISDMKHEGVYDLYCNIELPLAIVLGKMEYNGICCDSDVLDDMGKDISKKIDEVSRNIYDLCGLEFNIGSPKQLGSVLFEKLGLPHGKKGKSGNYSTDEATLSKLSDYPVVSYVLEYRMLSKLYSTYIEGLKSNIMDDGKIHTIYMQTLTRTGRLSSVEPNLQNIPVRNEYGRLIRKSFVSDKGYKFLSCDYSQIELRVFAHLASIDSMKKAFMDGIDIHTKTASDVYHVSVDDVTKNMRRNAKAVNFGIIYGISSYGLSRDLGISVGEAKAFIDNYYSIYPGIKTYMKNEVDKVRECGYVRTIMNRKRVINEINNSNYNIRSMGERMALNTPIQGSSADILKKAMVEIDREFVNRNLKSKMLLQIHDEVVIDVYEGEEDLVSKVVKDIMENTYKLSVPLRVDMVWGKNLYEAK